jgi:transcription elongation factor GreB
LGKAILTGFAHAHNRKLHCRFSLAMTRYRPPAPQKSAYITPHGYAALQAELQGLWKRRAEVTAALSAAAAEGDRSENAEYIYRKKELREIDRRIRYLQKRLPDLTIVHAQATDASRVYFGAWVDVEDEEGNEVTYRIVGPDEFDPAKGWISMDSPMARALMKKTVDDEVGVETPSGLKTYYVLGVSYLAR